MVTLRSDQISNCKFNFSNFDFRACGTKRPAVKASVNPRIKIFPGEKKITLKVTVKAFRPQIFCFLVRQKKPLTCEPQPKLLDSQRKPTTNVPTCVKIAAQFGSLEDKPLQKQVSYS